MAEDSSLKRVFEVLTEPVQKWPARSLFFFFTVLIVGYLILDHIKPTGYYLRVLLDLLTISLAGVVLSIYWLFVVPNETSRLKDPSVLQQIKVSFVGREEDARSLIELLLHSHQIWLNGDSGVGKSTLVQNAILKALKEQQIDAVYLNNWRGDWELSPAAAILGNLEIGSDDNVLGRLQHAFSISSERVIILDQFDEFQIEHREKLITERGQILTRKQLEERNRFIHILNSASRARHIRCLFITRRDVEWGKRAVLFEDATEMFLRRLEKNVVEGEIARVLDEAVERPENGWADLREKLCEV
jgi:hypothetical protein